MKHGGVPELPDINKGLIRLSKDMEIPLVATNDSHYVLQEHAINHDVLLCIQTKTNIHDDNRMRFEEASYHLRSNDEMLELFSDFPEAVANTEIDSYTLTLSTTPVVDGNGSLSSVGGSEVKATENAIMDVFSTQIGLMELPGTSLNATALVTRATSPSGSQTSFDNTRDDELVPTIKYPLNDNYKFEVPYMVCSTINETNELSSQRSFETRITMATENDRISPVIDLGRMSMVAVANRINNIDSSSDVYPTSDYVGSERAEGDENAAIYLTKQVTLANLATGLKVLFAAHRPSSNDLKVMYKILPIDESEDFDNLGYTYFNTDGSPDVTVPPSSSLNDFQEYEYSAGVTDDGIGDPLQEFISFQIKIIMQGTNCAEPPRLKGFRCLALGT